MWMELMKEVPVSQFNFQSFIGIKLRCLVSFKRDLASISLKLSSCFIIFLLYLNVLFFDKSILRFCRKIVQINFSFSLSSEEKRGYDMFYETFHGGSISIQYLISADVTRGYLHKALSANLEVIVEHDRASLTQAPVSPELTSFLINQDTQKHQLLPELSSGQFQITGNISTQCSLLEPISGEMIVEASAVPIRSIDIVLLRVESILTGERIISDTSIIQTTQIADGDVCRSMILPIYVILPRLLVCPTVLSGPFSIEFQVSIVISFQSELFKLYPKLDLQTPRPWLASQTLPLRIFRTA